ncbi:MAG TPA: glycosyltransferase N-terminal domain-containing protein, partial [Rhabdochlamydiaceae bacterium]
MLNLLLILFGIPWLLWQYAFRGKYRSSLKERLGLVLPPAFSKKVIWIHTVSMGETRAAATLYQALRKAYPDTPFVVSTTTETGQAEAKRSLPNADAYFYLPIDISWVVAKLVRRLQPSVLILVEGDIWPNLLKAVKKQGVKLFLVNGKISEKSTKRFGYFPNFTKRLFSLFDILCVQTKTYKDRFVQIGAPAEKSFVTGNLKYDAKFPELTTSALADWKRALKIEPQDRVITLGSTHDPEEEQLTKALADIPNLKILLVPRHPERFEALAKRYPATYSKREQLTGEERIILIDAMGVLPTCYQLSELAIVGGSFVDHIGGHNIL